MYNNIIGKNDSNKSPSDMLLTVEDKLTELLARRDRLPNDYTVRMEKVQDMQYIIYF